MNATPLLSIVIPARNKWELTRQCLISLARTVEGDDCEILLVDNASSDGTSTLAGPLGREIFGSRFQHLRQDPPRPFAASCNAGARAASGSLIFFLNNDTIALPGWRGPLQEAIKAENVGAVGPLLLYPHAFGLPDRVQHAGIVADPRLKVSHIYQHFPATHPLVNRNRCFQAITGAALLVRREEFLGAGGFHEGYVNGFEDVDFCLRFQRGRLMVVPAARLYHLCGQTPGRGDHEEANARLLTERCQGLLHPDEYTLAQEDGYRLRLTPWLDFETCVPEKRAFALARRHGLAARKEKAASPPGPPEADGAVRMDEETEAALRQALEEEPLWHEGYRLLAQRLEACGAVDQALALLSLDAAFSSNPPGLIPLFLMARRHQPDLAASLREIARCFVLSPQERARQLRAHRAQLRRIQPELAADADKVLADLPRFIARDYQDFLKVFELSS